MSVEHVVDIISESARTFGLSSNAESLGEALGDVGPFEPGATVRTICGETVWYHRVLSSGDLEPISAEQGRQVFETITLEIEVSYRRMNAKGPRDWGKCFAIKGLSDSPKPHEVWEYNGEIRLERSSRHEKHYILRAEPGVVAWKTSPGDYYLVRGQEIVKATQQEVKDALLPVREELFALIREACQRQNLERATGLARWPEHHYPRLSYEQPESHIERVCAWTQELLRYVNDFKQQATPGLQDAVRLEGSSTQVTWALDLRIGAIQWLEQARREYEGLVSSDELPETDIQNMAAWVLDELEDLIMSVTSAKRWIEAKEWKSTTQSCWSARAPVFFYEGRSAPSLVNRRDRFDVMIGRLVEKQRLEDTLVDPLDELRSQARRWFVQMRKRIVNYSKSSTRNQELSMLAELQSRVLDVTQPERWELASDWFLDSGEADVGTCALSVMLGLEPSGGLGLIRRLSREGFPSMVAGLLDVVESEDGQGLDARLASMGYDPTPLTGDEAQLLLEHSGLRRGELASLLGISRATTYNWTKGHMSSGPGAAMLRQLFAEILHSSQEAEQK